MTAPAKNAATNEQGADSSVLVRAAQSIFKAAARLLLGRMPANTAIQLLKEAYVEEARARIARDPKQSRVTRSALSLMTGIDARHIAAMEKAEREAAPQTPVDTFITVIEQWAKRAEWTDANGAPAELPIYGPGGSFQTLVRHVAGNNVTPQTVLQRLIEHGNVEYVDDGKRVRLVNRYYDPVNREEMKVIDAGSLTFERLANTIHNNAQARDRKDALLQQDRWSAEVPVTIASEVCQGLREILQESIDKAEAYLENIEEQNEGSNQPKIKVGSGWFVFQDEIEPPNATD